VSVSSDSTGRQPHLALPRGRRIRRPQERVKVERPQAEHVAERPLRATEDGHTDGSEEGPRHQMRCQTSPTKCRPLINNWICSSPISGVRTHLHSHPEFSATYAAIARRRGKKIATIAIARKLLTRSYHLLADAQAPDTTAPGTRDG
jgi:hypothetical protein